MLLCLSQRSEARLNMATCCSNVFFFHHMYAYRQTWFLYDSCHRIPVDMCQFLQPHPLVSTLLSNSPSAMAGPRPVVLSGPSGAGKSTLLKKLMKEYDNVFGFSVSRKSTPEHLTLMLMAFWPVVRLVIDEYSQTCRSSRFSRRCGCNESLFFPTSTFHLFMDETIYPNNGRLINDESN